MRAPDTKSEEGAEQDRDRAISHMIDTIINNHAHAQRHLSVAANHAKRMSKKLAAHPRFGKESKRLASLQKVSGGK